MNTVMLGDNATNHSLAMGRTTITECPVRTPIMQGYGKGEWEAPVLC